MGDAVDDLARAAAAAADATERLRRLPDEVAALVVDSGLPRALVPARYGGGERPLQAVLDDIERVAHADGAAAWCAMIAATTGLTAGFLPADHAEAIYADPASVTGGFALPVGRARRVEGGLVVDGRWPRGSGTHHCTWIGGGCRVEGEKAAPFVFFERGQVELLDTWHVAGLRGTGSGDYAVRDAFVPVGRWLHIGRDAPTVDGPLYRFPFMGALALGVASVGLGLARRALDELVDLAGGKVPAQSSRTLAERPVVQAQVARADAARRSAAAFVREAVEQAWDAAGAADGGEPLGAEHARLLRLAATDATWRSAEAVDLAYHAGGGSSIHEASPLQRVFRDVHVVTQHGMVAERTYEPLGRIALGLPTDPGSL